MSLLIETGLQALRSGQAKRAAEYLLLASHEGALDDDVLAALGLSLLLSARPVEARDVFNRVLRTNPRNFRCLVGAAAANFSVGCSREAAQLTRGAISEWRAWHPLATDHITRVVVLASIGAARLTIDCLGRVSLDDGHNNLYLSAGCPYNLLWLHECASEPACGVLREADLILSAISEPDIMHDDLRVADQLLASSTARILNRPQAVLKTRRDKICAIVQDVPNVICPLTIRGTLETLVRSGLKGRVILRPAGSHGGREATLFESIEHIKAVGLIANQEIYYLTEFVDFGSAGDYRKARFVWIDGEMHVEHLMTSDQWNVHSETARPYMRRNPHTTQAEMDFIEEHPSHEVMANLMKIIAERTGMDCFMADVGLDRNDQVVFFEANASMRLIQSNELLHEGPHLAQAVNRIGQAIETMFSSCDGARQGRA